MLYCIVLYYILLNCVATAVAAIIAVTRELVSLAIVVLALGSMNIHSVPAAIYWCTFYDKCTYCKSLWIKASAKWPKCKCKCKSTYHTINYNTWVHSCTRIENVFFYYYYWQQSAEHYRVPPFHSLFSQLNTEINFICPRLVICEMKQKNQLSFSGKAVVCDIFLLRCFFYLSLTHAPIIHQSMLLILWMQRNIWCWSF